MIHWFTDPLIQWSTDPLINSNIQGCQTLENPAAPLTPLLQGRPCSITSQVYNPLNWSNFTTTVCLGWSSPSIPAAIYYSSGIDLKAYKTHHTVIAQFSMLLFSFLAIKHDFKAHKKIHVKKYPPPLLENNKKMGEIRYFKKRTLTNKNTRERTKNIKLTSSLS